MAEHARGQAPMPVSETMVRLTIDIIGSTGFGGYPMNALFDSKDNNNKAEDSSARGQESTSRGLQLE